MHILLCQEYHNCLPFGGLEETTRTSSNYVDEDYSARPEIKQSLTGWGNNCGSESSILETDICVWRYALLVVYATQEEEEDITSATILLRYSCLTNIAITCKFIHVSFSYFLCFRWLEVAYLVVCLMYDSSILCNHWTTWALPLNTGRFMHTRLHIKTDSERYCNVCYFCHIPYSFLLFQCSITRKKLRVLYSYVLIMALENKHGIWSSFMNAVHDTQLIKMGWQLWSWETECSCLNYVTYSISTYTYHLSSHCI